MARAMKKPKAPRKSKAREAQEGAHFVDDEDGAGPVYTEKLTPAELTAIAVEGMELQGKLDALETEEGVLKEKMKLATKEVRKRIRETRATVSRLAKEYRNGVREIPAQGKLPGTEPPRPSLRVVEEAKEISTWATTPSADTPPPANDPEPATTPEEGTAPAAAPESTAPVAAEPADDGGGADF